MPTGRIEGFCRVSHRYVCTELLPGIYVRRSVLDVGLQGL